MRHLQGHMLSHYSKGGCYYVNTRASVRKWDAAGLFRPPRSGRGSPESPLPRVRTAAGDRTSEC